MPTPAVLPVSLTATPKWRGWVRANRRQPWRLVCVGDTYSGCWGALLALAPERCGDQLVARGNSNPNATPRRP